VKARQKTHLTHVKRDFTFTGILNKPLFSFSRKSCSSFLFRVHSKGASVKTPNNEIQNSNLASANASETETTNFKTAKIHNAYIQNAQCQKAQFCCIATNSQKHYSFIAEQFCKVMNRKTCPL
jgi:hypothetical protein